LRIEVHGSIAYAYGTNSWSETLRDGIFTMWISTVSRTESGGFSYSRGTQARGSLKINGGRKSLEYLIMARLGSQEHVVGTSALPPISSASPPGADVISAGAYNLQLAHLRRHAVDIARAWPLSTSRGL
jgi:hypothetical protein